MSREGVTGKMVSQAREHLARISEGKTILVKGRIGSRASRTEESSRFEKREGGKGGWSREGGQRDNVG